MQYWWVNHNKTARQEITGGYLWSPKREANGARSQFYDNMRRAEPGDAVLSFSNGLVSYIGFVTDFATPALKPGAFVGTGDYWSNDGWLLPVSWQPLATPLRPKNRIAEIGPLLPKRHSPLQAVSGNGNQKAYLAEISAQVFDLVVGDNNFEPHVPEANAVEFSLQRFDDSIETQFVEDPHLDSTIKHQLILARRGQGVFRARLCEIEQACRLTGIDNPCLLVASHIKPWRACSTAKERLDGANGLLLTPHVDRLFDRGLITFRNDGTVSVSYRLPHIDLERLGLASACARVGRPFNVRQSQYLSFHQENVYLG